MGGGALNREGVLFEISAQGGGAYYSMGGGLIERRLCRAFTVFKRRKGLRTKERKLATTGPRFLELKFIQPLF